MGRRRERTRTAKNWLIGGIGAALFFGCGDTSGESIEFAAAARPVVEPSMGESPRSFVNARGWAIELDRAEVVLGPIHLHGGEPGARAWLPSLISVAYAHPADAAYDGGPPLGDILEQRLIDLTEEEPTSLGRVFGLKGQLATLEVQLHPPTFASTGALPSGFARMGEASFSLEGEARKDGTEVRFAAEGILSEVPAERVIGNIEADVALRDGSERPGRLLIEVHVDEWFRRVDFEREHQLDARGRVRFPLGSPMGNALRWGIGSRFAYSARWSEP